MVDRRSNDTGTSLRILQYGHVLHMPGLCRIRFLTILKWRTLPLLNKKELDIRRQESFWSLSGTHTSIFWRFQLLTPALRLLQPLNRPLERFFKIFYDRQRQRQTNKTNCLTPLAHTRCGVKIAYELIGVIGL